jgi:hypothetical protein
MLCGIQMKFLGALLKKYFILNLILLALGIFPLANISVHEVFLSGRFGNQWQFWVNSLTSVLLYGIYCFYLSYRLKKVTLSQGLVLGIWWSVAFLISFVFLAYCVFNIQLGVIVSNMNPLKGEILPLIMFFMLTGPSITFYFMGR